MKKKKMTDSVMDHSIIDSDIYNEDSRDQMLDDDELTGWEAAFMVGYEEASV